MNGGIWRFHNMYASYTCMYVRYMDVFGLTGEHDSVAFNISGSMTVDM